MIPAGTTIICLKRHVIGTLKTDLPQGQAVMPKDIDYTEGQGNIAGEPMSCKQCGRSYSLDGHIYTEAGWQPGTPTLEQPPFRR